MAEPIEDEHIRTARLLDAQDKAAQLFAQVEERHLVVPGVMERQASDGVQIPPPPPSFRPSTRYAKGTV